MQSETAHKLSTIFLFTKLRFGVFVMPLSRNKKEQKRLHEGSVLLITSLVRSERTVHTTSQIAIRRLEQ